MTDGPAMPSAEAAPAVVLQSTITCPACGHRATHAMPTDACQRIHVCAGCGGPARRRELLAFMYRDLESVLAQRGAKGFATAAAPVLLEECLGLTFRPRHARYRQQMQHRE